MIASGKKNPVNIGIAAAVITAAVVLAFAYYISRYHYQLLMIQGSSMEPSYHPFQIVVIDKHIREPSRGDAVVFSCDNVSVPLIKRVAACPGDSVVIMDNILYVNNAPVRGESIEYAGLLREMIVLGENEYIVLGDNVNESIDSRYEQVGIVSAENIIGRVK